MSCRSQNPTQSIEYRARRRVALKGGLFIHALVYALVNGGLYLLWTLQGATTAAGLPRTSHLPLWGWALGLAVHAVVILVLLGGEGMRQRWVERELRALRGSGQG